MVGPRSGALAATLLLLLAVAGCGGTARTQAPASPRPLSRYPHTEADTNGASPQVLRLAERILAGQQDEIASMQRWLRDRGRPVPDGHHGGHGHLMPGMLTGAQLEELEAARGAEFDRLFLTFMIQHHRGAVAMVKDLFGTPGAARDETVFKFADDVGVDQTTEIARMERMLAALPPGEPSS
jgi:uncharacterized protein (DUF305 family)